jgi:hypothetical protein
MIVRKGESASILGSVHKNKIRGSRAEKTVIDLLLRNIGQKRIQEILKEELDFTIGIDTITSYRNAFFIPLKDDAVKHLVEIAKEQQARDEETTQRIFKIGSTLSQDLESLISTLEKKVVELESRKAELKEKKKFRAMNSLEGFILRYTEQLKDARTQLAEIKEGPSGSDAHQTQLVNSVLEIAIKTFCKYIDPEKRGEAIRELKGEMRRIKT